MRASCEARSDRQQEHEPGVQNGSNVAATTVESAASAAGTSCRSIGTGTAAGFAARSGLAFVTIAAAQPPSALHAGRRASPEMDGEPLSRWSPRRLDCERRLDHLDQHGREIGPLSRDRRRARFDRGGDLRQGYAPERVLSGERFPEQHPDGPHVAGCCGLAATKPLGRDVGEGSRHVADRRQRIGLVELGKPEIEEPHRDLGLLLDEHVGRLHVAVHDPEAVCMGQAVEDLRRCLDRVAVGQLAGAQRLAHRRALHVLVRDVDMAAVAPEVVGSHAPLVAQPRGGLHLSGRA